MFFFSAILLSLVQFAFLAYNPNDPYVYGKLYCLNLDGSTECTATTVAKLSFFPGHDDQREYLGMQLTAANTKGNGPVTVSASFNVKGKPYTFSCYKAKVVPVRMTYSDFTCGFQLNVTANSKQVAPITNSSISIDLVTIDDNVPITLGYNGIKSVVAPNLKESLIHQLSYLECYEPNTMSFADDDKKNRVWMKKRLYDEKEMEIFIYGLGSDTKSTDRSVKFVNADGVSLTVSCNKSFSTLSGFVQKGDKKESIDKLFTFKSLNGYRCGFKLPFVVQTDNIKFDFDLRPLDFSLNSTSGSSINKPNIKFHTDDRDW